MYIGKNAFNLHAVFWVFLIWYTGWDLDLLSAKPAIRNKQVHMTAIQRFQSALIQATMKVLFWWNIILIYLRCASALESSPQTEKQNPISVPAQSWLERIFGL